MLGALDILVARHCPRFIALSGGVFANVKLNQRIYERFRPREIFIVPFMGDDGLALGGVLEYLLRRRGMAGWLAARRRLEDLYWAPPPGPEAEACFAQEPRLRRLPDAPAEGAARLLAEGKIVGLFRGRMEFGPRALGARSILASPLRHEVNAELNKRLERTEFMPFAPYVAEEDAGEVFAIDEGNRYACRFMTITTEVRPAWRARIPGVVHVDGTARPQIVARAANPLYYDILSAFKRLTGIPVLVNTSFNVHEEPIVNGAAECLAALRDGRIDVLVTETGIYSLGESTTGGAPADGPHTEALRTAAAAG